MKFPFGNLKEILLSTAAFGSNCQLDSGAMPAGRNGPHNHNMTGARETAHWAILFAYCSEVLGASQYRDNAVRAYDALTSKLFVPIGGAYWHRKEDGKSSYNGLIGQAWTLESLYYGFRVLKNADLLEAGLSLIRKHIFDEMLGLWFEVDLDGSRRQIGGTLNQQIWFTAMAVKFTNELNSIGNRFLDRLTANSMIRKNGLFYTGIRYRSMLHALYSEASKIRRHGIFSDPRFSIDCGYHLFTLLGLSFLYENFPQHSYFSSLQFERALNYAFTDQYATALAEADFGYQYNVPGLEYPFVYAIFGHRLQDGSFDIVSHAFRKQFLKHLDMNKLIINQNSVDPITLTARTYEIYRIPEDVLHRLPEIDFAEDLPKGAIR